MPLKQIATSVDLHTYDRVVELAKHYGVTKSTLIRAIIHDALDKHKEEKKD